MTLRLYDTMTRQKRVFEPADPKRVTLYVCGPTVYNYAHIGNARAFVAFDLLYRVLRRRYGPENVVYARNITDIDDKIIKAAQQTGEPIDAVTEKFTKIFHTDMAALKVLPPDLEPTATGHIPPMVAMIEKLVAAGAAYAAQGHVLFAVDGFSNYGKLSGVDQDEMIAGARVEVAPYKKNPADFVLWKPSSDAEPGWDSPWGRGRPGWHLECSTMIEKNLGETIDIHGGGQDLRFPHHENEIAQSACAHDGAPLARYWMHNGFLRMGSDKMSKSLGNVVPTHDLLKKWPGEAVRWALLSAHYRQPLEWTEALLVQSKRQLDRFYRLLEEIGDSNNAVADGLIDPLYDDLNTPEAFAGLHELRDIAGQSEGKARADAIARMRAAGRLMGFFNADPEKWRKGVTHEASATTGVGASLSSGGEIVSGLTEEEIEKLLSERAAARRAKDFAAADRIRDALAAKGVIVEDGPGGVTWRRA